MDQLRRFGAREQLAERLQIGKLERVDKVGRLATSHLNQAERAIRERGLDVEADDGFGYQCGDRFLELRQRAYPDQRPVILAAQEGQLRWRPLEAGRCALRRCGQSPNAIGQAR